MKKVLRQVMFAPLISSLVIQPAWSEGVASFRNSSFRPATSAAFASQTIVPAAENVLHPLLAQKKYFHEWTEVFRDLRLAAQKDLRNYSVLTFRFLTAGEVPLKKEIWVPNNLSNSSLDAAIRYAVTMIYNTFWLVGSYGLWIETDRADLFHMIRRSFQEGYVDLTGRGSIRAIIQSTYGMDDFPIVAGEQEFKDLRALHQAWHPVQEPVLIRRSGRLLVVNVGMSTTKSAVVERLANNQPPGFIGAPKETETKLPEDNPDAVREFLGRVIDEARGALERARLTPKDIDGIVLSTALLTAHGRVPARNSGLFNQLSGDNLEEASHIGEALSRAFGGIPVYCLNDGDLHPLAATGLSGWKDMVLLRFGTFLCAGLVLEGKIPNIVRQLDRLIVDMSGKPIQGVFGGPETGTIRQYTAMQGIINIARGNPLAKKVLGGVEDQRIPNLLNEWLQRKSQDAGADEKRVVAEAVFKEVGAWMGALSRLLLDEYAISTFVLGGSFFTSAGGAIVRESMAEFLQDVPVAISYFSESKEELKFGGLKGATFLSWDSLKSGDHLPRRTFQDHSAPGGEIQDLRNRPQDLTPTASSKIAPQLSGEVRRRLDDAARRIVGLLMQEGYGTHDKTIGLIALRDSLSGISADHPAFGYLLRCVADGLTPALTSSDSSTRVRAYHALGELADVKIRLGEPGAEILGKGLVDPDAEVRMAAAWSFMWQEKEPFPEGLRGPALSAASIARLAALFWQEEGQGFADVSRASYIGSSTRSAAWSALHSSVRRLREPITQEEFSEVMADVSRLIDPERLDSARNVELSDYLCYTDDARLRKLVAFAYARLYLEARFRNLRPGETREQVRRHILNSLRPLLTASGELKEVTVWMEDELIGFNDLWRFRRDVAGQTDAAIQAAVSSAARLYVETLLSPQDRTDVWGWIQEFRLVLHERNVSCPALPEELLLPILDRPEDFTRLARELYQKELERSQFDA